MFHHHHIHQPFFPLAYVNKIRAITILKPHAYQSGIIFIFTLLRKRILENEVHAENNRQNDNKT